MRSIATKVTAKPFQSNTDAKQSFRVIGTTDIDGKGTEHPLADVDPFVFLDETQMRGDQAWPFPKHPHSGLVAMTYMLDGEIKPWDSMNGKAPFTNRKGGFYYINSGRGIIHEEEPIVEGGPLRWLQLWMNPGIYPENNKAAFAKLTKYSDIPEIELENAFARIVVGEAFGKTSPAETDWPIQYVHISVKPGQSVTVPLQDSSWKGFAYLTGGTGSFGSNNVTADFQDCLVLGSEDSTELTANNSSTDELLEFVVLTGKPHNKPFYKILGGGGALIASSEEKAREDMARFEKDQESFGKN